MGSKRCADDAQLTREALVRTLAAEIAYRESPRGRCGDLTGARSFATTLGALEKRSGASRGLLRPGHKQCDEFIETDWLA